MSVGFPYSPAEWGVNLVLESAGNCIADNCSLGSLGPISACCHFLQVEHFYIQGGQKDGPTQIWNF